MKEIKFVQSHGKWLLRSGWDFMLDLTYNNPVDMETISTDMDELYRTMKAWKMYWVAEHHPDTGGTKVKVVLSGGHSLNIGGVELVWVGKGSWEMELWADVVPEDGGLVLGEDDAGVWMEAEQKGCNTVIGFLQ